MDVWEKEGWKEMPQTTYSMMSMVGIHNNDEGLSILTNGLREYEVVGERYNTMAITLMRGIGVLGKENLYTRPGRPSGIKLPCPDSQMLGKQRYELAIYTHKGNTLEGETFKAARDFTTPYETYNKIPYDAMKLNLENIEAPARFGLLEMEGNAELSIVKNSENDEYIAVRIFNGHRDRTISETITFNVDILEAYESNMNEEISEKLEIAGDAITITDVKPCQARTILVKVK